MCVLAWSRRVVDSWRGVGSDASSSNPSGPGQSDFRLDRPISAGSESPEFIPGQAPWRTPTVNGEQWGRREGLIGGSWPCASAGSRPGKPGRRRKPVPRGPGCQGRVRGRIYSVSSRNIYLLYLSLTPGVSQRYRGACSGWLILADFGRQSATTFCNLA